MARENPGWGYDRIAGALKNLGHRVSDQTVGNILRRFGIAPAPKRHQQTTWADFIRSHMAVLTGIDFFTVKCSPGAASLPTTFCSFCAWRRGMSLSRALPDIPPRNEWCKWRVEPWMPLMARCRRFASRYMTATPSSALPFEPCCALAEFNLLCCRPQSEPECLC